MSEDCRANILMGKKNNVSIQAIASLFPLAMMDELASMQRLHDKVLRGSKIYSLNDLTAAITEFLTKWEI